MASSSTATVLSDVANALIPGAEERTRPMEVAPDPVSASIPPDPWSAWSSPTHEPSTGSQSPVKAPNVVVKPPEHWAGRGSVASERADAGWPLDSVEVSAWPEQEIRISVQAAVLIGITLVSKMPQLQHHPILFGRRTASSFAHFVAGYVCAGYHVDMVSTNAAFLMWLTGLVYALVTPWTVAEQAHIAWILMLCAFCNFFAVATTRFNDSGFTSGLAFWLPPLFLGNFLLLFVGALPTMLVGGCLSGYFVASSQTAPLTLGVASLVALAALFFYDVWAWLPQVGHLGGAGSSEPWAAFRALSVRKKGLLEELRKASTALTSGPACFRLLLQYPS
eukprot:s341_g12.t4